MIDTVSSNAESVGEIIGKVEAGEYGYVNKKGIAILTAIYDRLSSVAGTVRDKITDREQATIDGITTDGWYSYERKPLAQRTQYVYIALDQENVRYKIGRSTAPMRRIKSMRTALPGIALLSKWEVIGSDVRDFEERLHQEFAENRVSGEWFKFDFDPCEAKWWFDSMCLRIHEELSCESGTEGI